MVDPEEAKACVVAAAAAKDAAEDVGAAARAMCAEAKAYRRRMTPAAMAAVVVPKGDDVPKGDGEATAEASSTSRT